MKKYILIIVILVFSTGFIFSQSSRPRVGILDFTANNISQSEATIVGEIFTTELVMSGKFDVVDRKNVESLMSEMEFQMTGCTDSSCAVEVGQILSLEYMMYGSINKLGESLIINIYMINVGTAQIEGSAKERFSTIEESYDVMPVVIQKLIEGESYTPATGVAVKPETEAAGGGASNSGDTSTESDKGKVDRISGSHLDLGIGAVISNEQATEGEHGLGIEGSYRYMFNSNFGLGGGILLGYGFGASDSGGEPGIKFGINLRAHLQLYDIIGFAVGFKGLPTYINYFGGPDFSFYFGPYFLRIGTSILGNSGTSIDFGYSIKL